MIGTEDLIEDTLSFSRSKQINYKVMHYSKTEPSLSFPFLRLMIVNGNWKLYQQLPFQICHEIAHILHGDKITIPRYNTYSLKVESAADRLAVKILVPIYLNDIWDYDCDSVVPIMNFLKIPANLLNLVTKVAKEYIELN